MTEQNEQPLVSIIVITYNSAQFVLETLESAKAQTYENIELIVSDDASTDDTVAVCRNWINENKERFVRTELITVPENTGIPANCNRGLRAAKGEWVKYIAGDDALMGDCVKNNLNYTIKMPQANVVFSLSERYYYCFSDSSTHFTFPKSETIKHPFFSSDFSAQNQYQILLGKNLVNAPTVFIRKSIVIDVGCFDERFKLNEDYPFWLKITKANHKMYFMNLVTVKHRIHPDAVYNSTHKSLIKPSFFTNEKIRKEYVYPNISIRKRLDYLYRYHASKALKVIFLNKSNIITQKIRSVILFRLNPFR